MSNSHHDESSKQTFSSSDFSEIFQQLSEAVYLLEVDLPKHAVRLIQVNKAACDQTGFTKHELSELCPATLFGTDIAIINKWALLVECNHSLNSNLVTKNNDCIPIEINARSIALNNNRKYLLLIIRNNSHQKHVLGLLEKRTKQFESLFHYNPNVIFSLDINRKLTSINPAGLKLLKYDEDQLIGNDYQRLIPSSQRLFAKKKYEEIICGNATQFQLNVRNQNRNNIELDITAVPILINAEVTGLIGIARDITEENRTKHLLEESKQQYKVLFDNNIDSVVSLNKVGEFTDINQATEKIIGFTRKELLGKSFLPIIVPKERAQTKTQFEQAIIFGQATAFETCMFHRNGRLVHLHLTIIPILIDSVITGMHCIAKDITENKRLVEQLNHIAYHDHLTDLSNSLAFDQDLEVALVEATKTNNLLAVLFLDLDRFKSINDSLGHAQGDLLLKKVAIRLNQTLANDARAYRYGGDEFIILIEKTNQQEIEQLTKRLMKNLITPYTMDGLEIVNTPSIGISIYPNDGIDSETLIKKADNAMYHAKRVGKSNFQFYQEQMAYKIYGNMEIESLLRKAIERDEFFLLYQPQVDTHTKHIVGVEALIRWENIVNGLVLPNDFIPLAEESGLIVPIGEWIIRTACKQAKVWQDTGITPFPISVNLSIRQFYQENLTTIIKDSIDESGLDPQYLVLEITESMAMDVAVATNILRELKEIGVKVSIDDFGTGYSSLNHLKEFPIDYLKIDQSFVRDITTDSDDRNIIEIIILLGHKLGMCLIAEGVETKEHVDFLEKLECDILQGYFYSKPIGPEEIPKFIDSILL